MHALQIREHGGLPGIRDENALESALARPRHRFHYEEAPGLAALAAAYGYGLASNHGYSDGNKRVAFMAMYVFLSLNGLELNVREPEAVETIRQLAAGQLSELDLQHWLEAHCEEK